MKMFHPLIGITLAVLLLFTFAAPVSAAKDSKKKDKKEERQKKSRKKDKKADAADAKAKVEEKTEIDSDNPFRIKLKRLERYKAALAETESASRKKRLGVRIKKIQDDIKQDHTREVARLKRVIHDKERTLRFENHKPFREKIEKEIQDLNDQIEKLDKWAGIEKKDAKKGAAPAAKGGKPAPAAKGGKKGPASAADLGLDLAM